LRKGEIERTLECGKEEVFFLSVMMRRGVVRGYYKFREGKFNGRRG